MYNIRNLIGLAVIIVIFFAGNSFAACTKSGTTYTCTDASYSSINAAVSAASSGDTINFPVSGSATWSSTVIIGKALTINGNGTTLTSNGSLTYGFFAVYNFSSTSLMRITGFTFMMDVNAGHGIYVMSVNLTQLRIDHNTFHYGAGMQIEVSGAKGVIDNNYFYNPYGYSIVGSAGTRAQADADWADLSMGTSNALFIENNHFIIDANYNSAYGGYGSTFDMYNGGKYVLRYNSWDSTNSPVSIPNTLEPFQLHGNACGGCDTGNKAYWQNDSSARRGPATTEFYGNTMQGRRVDLMTKIRGGAALIYNNAIVGTTQYGTGMKFYEEEYDLDQFTPFRTAWPAEDQTHNTFIWNNTYNGKVSFNTAEYISLYPSDKLQLNRDVFLHAPCGASDATDGYGNTCTHGKATFTGANGASGSYPTNGIIYPTKGTMVFTSAGDNAYLGYTPYTYPHPLATPTASVPVTTTYALSTSVSGSGTIISSPSGISCGSTCSASYDSGTSVTLTAVADTGYTFAGWSGACSGTGSCVVSMTAAKSVSATFTQNAIYYTLTTSKTGNGTLTSTPSGISCGSTCSYSYTSGTSVTVTATADSGYTFTGWSGACTGTGACTISMTAAKTVSATFTQNATYYTLTTSKTGNGTITSSPSGISCGSTCSTSVTSGTSITLTAVANTGYTFSGWSGACTGTGTCTVSMTAAKTVTATFTQNATYYTLTTNNSGNGTITSTPSGISCGATCAYSFTSGTSVSLTATPYTGYTFSGWSGACTGTGTCQVTMGTAKIVTATFAVQSTPTLSVTKKGYGRIKTRFATIVASAMTTNTGIDCGDSCVEQFSAKTNVTLSAEPDTGYTFSGWSGACSGTGDCTVTVEDQTTVEANFTASEATSGNTSSSVGTDGGGGGGCFIATAAFGSYLDPHVVVLREFRDKVLLTNYFGRIIVKFYYANSPVIANSISQNGGLRIATRLVLTPFIYAVAYPHATAMILLTALLIAMLVRRKKMAKLAQSMGNIYFQTMQSKSVLRVK